MSKGGNSRNSGGAKAAESARLFVALELPAFVKKSLEKLQADIRSDSRVSADGSGFPARWSAPENIHLTLAFLGDVPVAGDHTVPGEIDEALFIAVEGFSPVTLRAAGLSVFPGVRRARVLWTGVRGETDRLAKLQARVANHLEAVGFPKEKRRFTPHLTLARFKGDAGPEIVLSALERHGGFSSEPFVADALRLFQSRLTPKGPVYTVLRSYPLYDGKTGGQADV